MRSEARSAILMTLVLTALTGVAYPLAMTALAGILFPNRASGSLVVRDARVVGSELIGQAFSADRYFHPRPSAAGNGYDALASGGSNLGPIDRRLADRVRAAVGELRLENPDAPIPVDLVTTSASGLDPHLSLAAAAFQVARVARARGLAAERVHALVVAHTEGRQPGVLGE